MTSNEKIKAVCAYLFGLVGGIIVFCIEKENKTIKYHAAQSMAWGIIYTICTIVLRTVYVPFLGMALNIIQLLVMILGIIHAVKNEEYRFPVISNIADLFYKETTNV